LTLTIVEAVKELIHFTKRMYIGLVEVDVMAIPSHAEYHNWKWTSETFKGMRSLAFRNPGRHSSAQRKMDPKFMTWCQTGEAACTGELRPGLDAGLIAKIDC
jgi:hypothetical protein